MPPVKGSRRPYRSGQDRARSRRSVGQPGHADSLSPHRVRLLHWLWVLAAVLALAFLLTPRHERSGCHIVPELPCGTVGDKLHITNRFSFDLHNITLSIDGRAANCSRGIAVGREFSCETPGKGNIALGFIGDGQYYLLLGTNS